MNYPATNRLFTFACFSIPPVLGSVVSFVWHGGALWCLFEIARGRQTISRNRRMLILSCLLYIYVAANILSFLANAPTLFAAPDLIPLATFLLFPFSYSIWSIAEKDAVARAAALGGMTASYGGLVLALIQHFILDSRPEGAAGNALVFASVTCMAGAASLAGALTLETRWRIALTGGYLASVLAVLLSESRSVWLVMLLILILTLLVFRRQIWRVVQEHFLKMLAIFALIGILASGTFMERVENLTASWTNLTEHGEYDSSLGFRMALWEIGTEHFADRPILGNGPQNTRELIAEGLDDDFDLDAEFTHFHNGFLTLLVESGIIGGGAIIALFLFTAWNAIQGLRAGVDENTRFGAMLLLVLVLTYTVGGSVNLVFGQDIIDTAFMIFLIAGTFLACGESRVDERRRVQPLPSG